MSRSEPGILLSYPARLAVLIAAFLGLVFDGVELGLMPVASLSVSKSLLGSDYLPVLGGLWFARFTAALMLGAAIGGMALGNLGDRIGRARAMGISILIYSLFAGLGAWTQTQQQMLLLRFFVGLGVGGMWPNGVALVAESWPETSRGIASGVLGAGINVGVLAVSQVTRIWPVTAESWRWIFLYSSLPVLLAFAVLFGLPESPRWRRQSRAAGARRAFQFRQLCQPDNLKRIVIATLLCSIPLVGAWAGSKWMIPWADEIGGLVHPGYKSVTQGWWALGATLGGLLGAPLAKAFGRRLAYFLISGGATAVTLAMFQATAPLRDFFLPIVFVQGLIATLYFGWIPLYLPELFPLSIRATASGVAMNMGRLATAGGVLAAGSLFAGFGGSYPAIGAACACVYAIGAIAIWLAPETTGLPPAE